MRCGEASNVDQRQHNRLSIEGLSGNILNSNDLRFLNISINGAAIETSRRVELNREYTVRIHYRDSSFHVRALIVWAMLVSKEKADRTIVPFYRAGVKFIHGSGEIEDFIRSYTAAIEMKTQEEKSSRITYCF
jgi:hypothetical protein